MNATPAKQVADAIWARVHDGEMTRDLAASASEHRSQSHAAAQDEAIYFLGFATDLTIHRVFQQQPTVESALRGSFLDRLRDYAIIRRCTPCPVGDWLLDSPTWQVHAPGRDTGDPLQHLSDRFELYVAAMRRPTQLFLPVVGVLCALCDTRDIIFATVTTKFFIEWSRNLQDFLGKIHVTS
jgi:hypothetical protein